MNTNTKTSIKLFIFLTAIAFLTTGCTSAKSVPIVTINDKNLYLSDFLYDIYEAEAEGNKLEAYYKEHLNYSYWDYEYNETTMRQITKSSILATVVMYEILADQAIKKGMYLTPLEKSEEKEKTDNILAAASEDYFNRIGLTREMIEQSIIKKSLGDKYRNEISKSFHIDEDTIRKSIKPQDYKEYQTECLFIPTVKAVNQTYEPLSQEEIDFAQATMLDALHKLEEGVGFDGLLNEYDTLEYIYRDFIKDDMNCEMKYQSAAEPLHNDEYSQIVTTEYGLYIIHMLNNNATDKYEEAVEKAIEDVEDEKFISFYNKLKDDYDITINFDYWDTLTIGSIITPAN